MKTTGSIGCEIISEVVDTDLYQVSVKDERHMSVLFCVPKSAVTDIREEVDWSKVKKGALIIEINDIDSIVWFFAGIRERGLVAVSSYYKMAKNGEAEEERGIDNCMLLTDWLKEHGGQDE